MADGANKKVQVESHFNATGIKTGAGEAKQAIIDLTEEAKRQGQQAAQAVEGIGASASEAAKKTAAATQSINAATTRALRDTQRQLAEALAGGKNTPAFFEQLTQIRGGTAASVDPGIKSLAATLQQAAPAIAAFRQQQAGNSIVDELEREIVFAQKGKIGLLELKAAQAGVGDAVAPMIAKLRALEDPLNRVGLTAKQTAWAMRSVPAQFTDIAVSLQGGQNPLTVLFQQGGQLRDMFGSVGLAARAMGGYIVGLINPFTLAAAAAGALAYGFEAGRGEAQTFAKTLIETGNAAGTTVGQLERMAASVSAIAGGTQGNAASVLNQMAASGKVGAEGLERFTAAAVRMERAGGQAATETAKAFADLGREPLAASGKLNESMHYLTASTIAQIKALEDQGRQTDAAKVAQEAYAAALDDRAPQMAEQLGLLEKAWRGIKDATFGAGDALKNIGRPAGIDQRIADLQEIIANGGASSSGIRQRGGVSAAEEELRVLQRAAGYMALSAKLEADRAEQGERSLKWQKEQDGFLTRAEQRDKEITKARNEAVAAGAKEEEIERRIAMIRQKYDTGLDLLSVQAAEAQKLELYKRTQAEIDRLRSTGQLNERRAIEASNDVTMADFAARRQALEAEIAIESRKFNTEHQVAALRHQLALLGDQEFSARLKGLAAVEVALYRQKQAIDAVLRAERDQIAQEQADFFVQQAKAREAVANAISDYARSVQDESGALELEASLIGKGNVQRQIAIQQYQLQLQLRRRMEEIDRTYYEDGEAGRERERLRVREAYAKESANVTTRAWLDEWNRTTDEISSSLSDAIIEGFQNHDILTSFRKAFEAEMTKLVIKPVIQWGVSGLSSYASTALTLAQGGTAPATSTDGTAATTASQQAASLQRLASAFQQGGSMYGLYEKVATYFGLGSSSASLGASSYASGASLAADGSFTTGAAFDLSGTAVAGEGAAASGSAASSWGAVGGWVAAAILGAMKASSDYSAGFNTDGSRQVSNETGSFALGGYEAERAGLFKKLGMSDRWANILSGSTAVAALFGHASPVVTATGVSGSFSGGTSNAQAFADIYEKGGLFRSDKNYTLYGAISDELKRFLDTAATSVIGQATEWGKELGLTTTQLAGISSDFRVQLGDDAEANKTAITEALTKYGVALADGFKEQLAPLAIYGETSAQTLERVATSLSGVNAILKTLGQSTLAASISGATAATSLQSLFGDLTKFSTAADSYLTNYYSDAERTNIGRSQLSEQLAKYGLMLPQTRDQFRDLVEAQDLSTQSGREAYVALLSVADAFATLTESTKAAYDAIQTEIDRLKGVSASESQATLMAQFATTTAQARSGDATALAALPALSQELEKSAIATASSALDVARMRAWLEASLSQTIKLPGFASGGLHAGGLAIVGERGPELIDTATPARVYTASDTAQMLGTKGNAELVAQVQALNAQVADLLDAARASAMHAARTAKTLDRVAPDGDALVIRTATD